MVVIDYALNDSDWKALEDFVGQPLERREDKGALPLTSYRLANEPASHKLLDLMGISRCSSQPVRAHIRTLSPDTKPTHFSLKKSWKKLAPREFQPTIPTKSP